MDNAASTDGPVRRAPVSDRPAATFSPPTSSDRTPSSIAVRRSRESPGSGDASSPVWRQSWSLPAWGTAGRIPPEGRSSVSTVRPVNQPALPKLPAVAPLTLGVATLLNLGLFLASQPSGVIRDTRLIPPPSA